jgi:hypothetical protein
MVLGALALVFGALMLAKPSAAEAPRLEQYLPSDTVGFVQVSNLRAQALNIVESEAWRALSRENQSASSLMMMAVNHAGALDASYAVALLGTEADEKGNPRPALVLVGEFDSETERREFQHGMLQLGRRVNEKGVEANSEEYGNAKVTVVKKEGGEGFTYAQGGRTFLLSNSTDSIKKVLDVRAGKAKSLETSETFLRARTRTSSREGMFGYLDGAALARVVESAPAAMSQGGGAAFRQLFDGLGLKSLESVAMSSAFADGRVVERVAVAAPHAEGVLKTATQNPPTERALLALVPADALQAFDASVAGAPQVFDELLALAEQASANGAKPSPASALREFTEKTGIDLRGEIVGALGAEVCAAQLASGEERGGVFILSLKDEAAFARVLDRVAQQKKATVTSREYKGVTVRQMTGEKGHGPTYAFLNGNFVASGDAFAVERVIDTAQGGASLAASEAFRAAGAAVEGAPQFVYFNSNRDYLARLGAALSNKEHEFKTSGTASNLRPSFAFGVARADGFYVESRSPLGTFPRVLAAMTSQLSDNKGGKTAVKKVEKEAEKKAGAAE